MPELSGASRPTFGQDSIEIQVARLAASESITSLRKCLKATMDGLGFGSSCRQKHLTKDEA